MRKDDCNKLLKAGYRFIRADEAGNKIRYLRAEHGSYGWRIWEQGFATKKEMRACINELLKDDKTLEM